MIQPHLCDNSEGFRLEDIGRVVSAAHSNFDDADLDVFTGEDIKGGGSEDFKFGGFDALGFVAFQHLGFNFAKEGLGDGFLVDSDAIPPRRVRHERQGQRGQSLLPVNQMRRGKAARLYSPGIQERGQVCTDCAFAIRASDMDGLPWLRVVPEQLGCPLKPELYHPERFDLDWTGWRGEAVWRRPGSQCPGRNICWCI